jgi:hypothetical protein
MLRRDLYPLPSWLYDHSHKALTDQNEELSYWTTHIWKSFRDLVDEYASINDQVKRSGEAGWSERGEKLIDAFIGLSYDLGLVHANDLLVLGVSRDDVLQLFGDRKASLLTEMEVAWQRACEKLEVRMRPEIDGEQRRYFAQIFGDVEKSLEEVLRDGSVTPDAATPSIAPQNAPPIVQEWEAFKAIRQLLSGPNEQIPEPVLRGILARQNGIQPEDVSLRQIGLAVAEKRAADRARR